MATTTNGIATNAEIYNKSAQTYGLNNSQCPTKNTINSKNGGAITIKGDYDGTQCVRYSDINTNINIRGYIKNKVSISIENFTIKFGFGKVDIQQSTISDIKWFKDYTTTNPNGIAHDEEISFDLELDLSSITHNTPSIDSNGYDVNNVLILYFNGPNWEYSKSLTFKFKEKADGSYTYSFKSIEAKTAITACVYFEDSAYRYLTSKYFLNNKDTFQGIYIEVNPK